MLQLSKNTVRLTWLAALGLALAIPQWVQAGAWKGEFHSRTAQPVPQVPAQIQFKTKSPRPQAVESESKEAKSAARAIAHGNQGLDSHLKLIGVLMAASSQKPLEKNPAASEKSQKSIRAAALASLQKAGEIMDHTARYKSFGPRE